MNNNLRLITQKNKFYDKEQRMKRCTSWTPKGVQLISYNNYIFI